jgi:hypothetical protein
MPYSCRERKELDRPRPDNNALKSRAFFRTLTEMDSVLDRTTESRGGVCKIKELSDIPGFIQVVPGVFTEDECKRLIDIAEQTGFVKAALYTDNVGVEHFSDIRTSLRCIIDSHGFATAFMDRIKDYVPTEFNGKPLVGINERLRILKYQPGDEFKPHIDGKYVSPNGAISQITILIYLNEGYRGAYTCFHNGETWIPIIPKVGMVVLQDQDLYHCVPALEEGVKYAIRTEVMYQMPETPTGPYKTITVTV